ncbi:hypothetical protein M0802_008194 [Mischocyttarus mexicanus]|nr:hypothetical protein M0802_008194 [Mischocyttarus mexicanus]
MFDDKTNTTKSSKEKEEKCELKAKGTPGMSRWLGGVGGLQSSEIKQVPSRYHRSRYSRNRDKKYEILISNDRQMDKRKITSSEVLSILTNHEDCLGPIHVVEDSTKLIAITREKI